MSQAGLCLAPSEPTLLPRTSCFIGSHYWKVLLPTRCHFYRDQQNEAFMNQIFTVSQSKRTLSWCFLRCIIGWSGYETEADTRRGESHFACWSFDSDSVTRVCFDYISRHKWYIMCSIQSADLHSLPFLSSHLSLSSSCSCLDSRSVFCWQSPFWAPIEIMLMVDWLPPAPVFSSCPFLSLSHSLLMDPRGKSGPR